MKLKMTRKFKIVGLSVAIVALIALIVGTTLAYFNDTETSSGNAFTAGTMDLKLGNNTTTFADGVTATWGAATMAPGDTATGTLYVKNAGTLAANHVDITFANTVVNAVTPAEIGADDLDISKYVYVTALTWGGADQLAAAVTAFDAGAKDGKLSLAELAGKKIDNLTPPTPGNNTALVMTVQLDPADGNGNQGDSVSTTLTVALNQVAAQ